MYVAQPGYARCAPRAVSFSFWHRAWLLEFITARLKHSLLRCCLSRRCKQTPRSSASAHLHATLEIQESPMVDAGPARLSQHYLRRGSNWGHELGPTGGAGLRHVGAEWPRGPRGAGRHREESRTPTGCRRHRRGIDGRRKSRVRPCRSGPAQAMVSEIDGDWVVKTETTWLAYVNRRS